MVEKIESNNVLPKSSVGDVKQVGNFEIFLDKFPSILKVTGALAIIAAVFTVCFLIVFSHEPELNQFRQTAFTAIIGFASAAGGFLFGSWASKEHH